MQPVLVDVAAARRKAVIRLRPRVDRLAEAHTSRLCCCGTVATLHEWLMHA